MMAWPTGGARAPTDATRSSVTEQGPSFAWPPVQHRFNKATSSSPPALRREMTAVASFGNEVYVGGDDLVAVYNATQRRWTGATTIFGVPSAMAATATDLWVARKKTGCTVFPHQPEPLNNSRAARTHGGTPLWAWPLTRKTWC